MAQTHTRAMNVEGMREACHPPGLYDAELRTALTGGGEPWQAISLGGDTVVVLENHTGGYTGSSWTSAPAEQSSCCLRAAALPRPGQAATCWR